MILAFVYIYTLSISHNNGKKTISNIMDYILILYSNKYNHEKERARALGPFGEIS